MPVLPLAPPYYAPADFQVRTIVHRTVTDAVEKDAPGKLAALIAQWQAWIDGRLRKRYLFPILPPQPVPEIVLKWLTDLVALDVYRARGMNAVNDDFLKDLKEAHDKARDDVLEAADSKDGLFDLPLRDDQGATGIVAAKPLAHGDSSPYRWMDQQRCRGEREDQRGGRWGGPRR